MTIDHSSAIVVTVVADCTATPENDLCTMKSLKDTNVYGSNVDFNLCPESEYPLALFEDPSIGIRLGKAIRVAC